MRFDIPPEEEISKQMLAFGDVSGEQLDPGLVQQARAEEIMYYEKMGVYKKVPKQECYNRTGKAPIQVRWIDVNKGDRAHPNYRSRLVAKDFNTGHNDELFAATPPIEALRCVVSPAAMGS